MAAVATVAAVAAAAAMAAALPQVTSVLSLIFTLWLVEAGPEMMMPVATTLLLALCSPGEAQECPAHGCGEYVTEESCRNSDCSWSWTNATITGPCCVDIDADSPPFSMAQCIAFAAACGLVNLLIRGLQLAQSKHTAKCKMLVESGTKSTGFILNTSTLVTNSETGYNHRYSATFQFPLQDGRTVNINGQVTTKDYSSYVESQGNAPVQPLYVLYDESDPAVCMPEPVSRPTRPLACMY